MRKDAGLVKTEDISLIISSEVIKRLADFTDMLKERTNSKKLELIEGDVKGKFSFSAVEKFKGKEFKIWFNKV